MVEERPGTVNVTDVDNTTLVGCKVLGCCLEEEERGAEVGRQDLAPNLRGKYGSVIINHNKNFAAVTPRTIKFPYCLQCNCSTLLYRRVVFGAQVT